MTQTELEALKTKLKAQKEMSEDLTVLVAKLFGLLGGISALLPEEVKKILRKYGYEEVIE